MGNGSKLFPEKLPHKTNFQEKFAWNVGYMAGLK